MSIIKRNGTHTGNIPTFFNDFLTKDIWNWDLENSSQTGTTIPAVKIKENNEKFIVEMAAPGMGKNDFKVELNGNTLIISSEKNQEEELKEGERYSRKESSYQSFTRLFTLPKEVVDDEKIEARYEHGVLKLLILKKEEAKYKGPRVIQIS